MKLKICGITDTQQLQEISNLAVDYLGIIFATDSPRCVTNLNATTVFDIPNKIGVFRNQPASFIFEITQKFNLSGIQLHGSEQPEFIESLPKIKISKALSAQSKELQQEITKFEPLVDWLVLDNKSGGTGEKFNWQGLLDIKFTKPFFLAGGISIIDLPAVKTLLASDLPIMGIDISSGVETSIGIKSIKQIIEIQEGIKNL